ncbi:BsuPI-related putative proteinase inhibitor [Bacillus salacetis]|uniref:BsuPI-related putative proteinase inhibitor n=1 Tax=Bacillus salacetis TaxID=2315464 RepID=UPI003B9E722A
MKKAIVLMFSFILVIQMIPSKILAQKPVWSVEVKQGSEFAEIQFKVYNDTSGKMMLEFPSSKFFDYEVLNKAGEKVYKYSDDKAFLQAIQRITINSGETKIWQDKWNYTSSEGKRIPAGIYTIKAALMVKNINGKPVEGDLVQKVKITAETENPSFRNVEFQTAEGTYKIKGEAKVSAGCFYYTVEDGHDILREETLIKVNKEYPNWTSFNFTFNLAQGQLPKDRPVMLNLYERDLKDGTIYHIYTIRLN